MRTYFQYEFGSATDDEYRPLAWPLVQARVQSRIEGILESTGADSYQLYLTSDDKSNFRYNLATIKPYKGQRPSEKPYWYTHIRNLLVDFRGAIEVFGQEADDALGIAQCTNNEACKQMALEGLTYEETVICSRDKDLRMIPGWHYIWGAGSQKEKGPWYQSETDAWRSFYCQMLTGDSTDNIPGLYGVGKSSALLKKINSMEDELEMENLVIEEYQKRFGSYAEQFLLENGRLLWIRREEDELWTLKTQFTNNTPTEASH